MKKVWLTRRTALKLIGLSPVGLTQQAPAAGGSAVAVMREPSSGASSAKGLSVTCSHDFLSATLQWSYPERAQRATNYAQISSGLTYTVHPFSRVVLEIVAQGGGQTPLIRTQLPVNVTLFRFAVAPDTTYHWKLTPFEEEQAVLDKQDVGSFRTGQPVIDPTQADRVRYHNPRIDSKWAGMPQSHLVQVEVQEPLSPWFDRKSYSGAPPPAFETIRSRLPIPVLEADGGLLDLYWYCWKTLFGSEWLFPPTAPDHQAVANLLGARHWGLGGSTVVWDTCFMLHFARYANQAYPFVTALDNCYARQHDNGFICREADAQNREVYWQYPLNPPLFAWTEWEYYRISGDTERLRRVLTPIVKHYEWWMKYQRRANGLYWNDGYNEADDSPRNKLEYYTASAASYQAMAALYLARMAREVGRPDLDAFFTAEHTAIGKQVNTHFWDAQHSIYNDLTHDGRFITELEPGVFCKHVHMFWPLLAEVADRRGLEGMLAELGNPNSFDRASGVPSLSADSKDYREDGQYWRGSVWPPMQCMVQEGLRVNGEWTRARTLAEKYLHALLTAFQEQKTIYENLAPDAPRGYGGDEFVGWGGIGPVSNLIEYVLGLQVDVPAKTVEWHIERTDRHGLQNLGFGVHTVQLICERREGTGSPCHIEVNSEVEFTLKVIHGGEVTSHAITPGINTVIVGT